MKLRIFDLLLKQNKARGIKNPEQYTDFIYKPMLAMAVEHYVDTGKEAYLLGFDKADFNEYLDLLKKGASNV